MRKHLILAIVMTVLTAAIGLSRSSTPANEQEVGIAGNGLCTSFCLDNGDHCLFGTNYDHKTFQLGQLFVSKRHVLKTAWEPSTTGDYARWISKYGSVTLNAIGSQMVWGGMNEAGLMISTMSLLETEEPPPDERPPLAAPFWVQYQLDNFSTVEQVIASNGLVRPADAYDHYLVCDGKGECAVIEFLDGEMVVYAGSTLPVKALANSTYRDSLAALADGNYWKVEATNVNPNGPAAEAGIREEDWIIAVDGEELTGQQSMEALNTIIAQHESGDELDFTVIHPEETEPATVHLKMAPLPEDISKYQFPPGVPVQVLSLGFIPLYPGDFLTRFATAAEWVEAFEPRDSEEAVTYAFDTLEAVSMDDTVWSAVFDPANSQVHFRTNQNPQIRTVDLGKLDLSCDTPPMMMDVHSGEAGDISHDLLEYSHEMALDHAVSVATNLWQVDVSPLYVETVLGGFESFACMEDDASVLAAPATYLENHPPLLPPTITWTGLLILRRLWPVWISVTLLSFAFAAWRLARNQVIFRGKSMVWLLIVALLGPFGLLAHWISHRRHHVPTAV